MLEFLVKVFITLPLMLHIGKAVAQVNSIQEVDGQIVQFFEFTDWVGSEETIRSLIGKRQLACSKKHTDCLNIISLSKAICKMRTPERTHRIHLLWESIFANNRNEIDGRIFFNSVKMCSSKPTSGQLMISLVLFESFLIKKQETLANELLSWIEENWEKKPDLLLEEILYVHSYVLRVLLPFLITDPELLRRFAVLPLKWLTPEEISRLSLGILVLWTRLLSMVMPQLGQESIFIEKISLLELSSMINESLAWALQITAVRCRFLHEKKERMDRCRRDLEKLSLESARDQKIKLNTELLLLGIGRKINSVDLNKIIELAKVWDRDLYKYLLQQRDPPSFDLLIRRF